MKTWKESKSKEQLKGSEKESKYNVLMNLRGGERT